VRNGNARANIQANSAWAGLLLRYTKLHGTPALKRTFTYLQNFATNHPATGTNPTNPQTPEERNDLLIEALADGAQRNILCEIDTWHWYATPAARTRISQKFPNPNSFCVDADNDGFSPLNGDTPATIQVTATIDTARYSPLTPDTIRFWLGTNSFHSNNNFPLHCQSRPVPDQCPYVPNS
jgi:hypothetical protein